MAKSHHSPLRKAGAHRPGQLDGGEAFEFASKSAPVSDENKSWEYFRVEDSLYYYLRSSELFSNIIDSIAFRRLSDIRFLGAIDYFIRPTGGRSRVLRHTRQQHTIGVVRLAYSYIKRHDLSKEDQELIVAAALLHDIGHAPLSHSMEPSFKKLFGIDHHMATSLVIRGLAPASMGRAEIYKILKARKINIEQLELLINGCLIDRNFNYLFAHPVNIDTIEAIMRCKTYISHDQSMQTPNKILLSLENIEREGENIDDFWNLKDAVYNLLINGPLGVLADKTASEYLESNAKVFCRADFFCSERSLKRRHANLFSIIEEKRRHLRKILTPSSGMTNKITHYTKRRFYIQPEFAIGHPSRYAQSKSPSSISFSRLEQAARVELQQLEALFGFL